jgi:hypothetical protein
MYQRRQEQMQKQREESYEEATVWTDKSKCKSNVKKAMKKLRFE